jgi:hypothetical protein
LLCNGKRRCGTDETFQTRKNADDSGALFTITRPVFGKQQLATSLLEAERVLDDLGGAITVLAVGLHVRPSVYSLRDDLDE